jgi:hypothetical protein|tara:strand:+ start:246 stop:527 length:282 start_codon:yes stop_codon:yes gene_type:complete
MDLMSSKPMEKDVVDGRVTAGWVNWRFVIEISHAMGNVMTSLDQQSAQWLLERLMVGMDYMPGEFAQLATAARKNDSDIAEAAQAVERSQGDG